MQGRHLGRRRVTAVEWVKSMSIGCVTPITSTDKLCVSLHRLSVRISAIFRSIFSTKIIVIP